MKNLPNLLTIIGVYHLASSAILYGLIRIFAYEELRLQYSEGGIDAVFSITEGNYNFGLFLTLIFALAAILKGLELKQIEKLNLSRLYLNTILGLVVLLSSVYFTLLNLLMLFNPSYF